MKPLEPDYDALAARGFCLLDKAVGAGRLRAFERQVDEIARAECALRDIAIGSDEPIAAALKADAGRREFLFGKLRQLRILAAMTSTLLDRLEAGGLFARLGIRVPSVHQTLKGDLPGDDRYILPFHQDYRLTRSHRAIRLWVPLRAVDAIAGTMEMAVASHRDRFAYVGRDTDYPHIAESAIVGAYETVTLALPAGSAVVFDPSLVHRSVPNRGKRVRFALIVHVDDAASLYTQEEVAAAARP